MRRPLALVGAIAALGLAGVAHAADEPRYSLEGTKLVVESEAGREEIVVPCARAYDLVQSGGVLLVACGGEGAVAYTLTDPTHPTLAGRRQGVARCFAFVADGQCQEVAPSRPAPTSQPSVPSAKLAPAHVRALPRPQSVEEYQRRIEDLTAAIAAARRNGDAPEATLREEELRVVRRWIYEDTSMRSPLAVAGGLAMFAVGGVAVVALAPLAIASGAAGGLLCGSSGGVCTPDWGLVAGGVAMAVGGAVLVAVGVPVFAYGLVTVMNTKAGTGSSSMPPRSGGASTSALVPHGSRNGAPSVSLSVGPGSVALEGRF